MGELLGFLIERIEPGDARPSLKTASDTRAIR
jgi:hypothetical protein